MKIPIKTEGQIGSFECDTCGGFLVRIRGKYPGQARRIVCPTCAIEILEDIYTLNQGAQAQNEIPPEKNS